MEWAVLIMAYGGPDSLEDVEPYLLDVRGGRETPPALVEKIQERYALIGGRSPLLEITRAQADALEQALHAASNDRFKTFVGMRHWAPYIHQAVAEIKAAGISHVVGLCMAPYYSRMSIGAYQDKLRSALKESELDEQIDLRLVDSWHTHPLFIHALVEKTRAAEQAFMPEERGRLHYLFTAHSLPASIMEQGDQYAGQLAETAALVAQSLGLSDDRWQLCYQSAGAQSTCWLGPDLEEVLEDLAASGHRSVLVVPIGFVADHVEILFDIDIEAQETARSLGIHLERSESMNSSPTFIQALVEIVKSTITPQQEM